MNRVNLVGRLVRDPELRMTQNQIPVCSFTVAVNRRFAKQDDPVKADFVPVVVWRNQAEACNKYLRKGSRVSVCGAIQTRTYDANDGSKRYVTEIVADEVEFLSTKERGQQEDNAGYGEQTGLGMEISEENLPF